MGFAMGRAALVLVTAGGLAVGSAGIAVASEGDDRASDDSPLSAVTDAAPSAPGGDGANPLSTDQLEENLRKLSPAAGEESPLQPVADVLCTVTNLEIKPIGTCKEETAPRDGKDEAAPEDTETRPIRTTADDTDDRPAATTEDNDDSRVAPAGGIETGGGGTARSEAPVGLLTGAALSGVAAVLAWRRRLDLTS